MLGFLSIFHTIGALALANGLRGLWRWLRREQRRPGNALFLIVWGIAFLIALLFWDEAVDWLRPFLHPNFFLIGFGGVFMLVGAVTGSLVVRDDLWFGLLFGGIFLLVGGVFFALGIWNLLKELAQEG